MFSSLSKEKVKAIGGDARVYADDSQIGTIELGGMSNEGTRYGKLNQDWLGYTVIGGHHEDMRDRCIACTVADGHGLLGERAAEISGVHIMDELRNPANEFADARDMNGTRMAERLTTIYHEAHDKIMKAIYEDPPQELKFPPSGPGAAKHRLKVLNGTQVYLPVRFGEPKVLELGTTATTTLVHGSTLIVANVGDSAAVLGYRVGSAAGPSARYEGQWVTTRHWCRDEAERRRVTERWGKECTIGEDGYLGIRRGPWAGFELAVTRSLGHKLMANYGVVPTPTVRKMGLRSTDACLIVASDGIWDVMEPTEAVRHVMASLAQGMTPREAAGELVKDCIMLALDLDGDADNTTAAVLVLPTYEGSVCESTRDGGSARAGGGGRYLRRARGARGGGARVGEVRFARWFIMRNDTSSPPPPTLPAPFPRRLLSASRCRDHVLLRLLGIVLSAGERRVWRQHGGIKLSTMR